MRIPLSSESYSWRSLVHGKCYHVLMSTYDRYLIATWRGSILARRCLLNGTHQPLLPEFKKPHTGKASCLEVLGNGFDTATYVCHIFSICLYQLVTARMSSPISLRYELLLDEYYDMLCYGWHKKRLNHEDPMVIPPPHPLIIQLRQTPDRSLDPEGKSALSLDGSCLEQRTT